MKVIDLFVKIANGEEPPKKIKYDEEIYTRTKVIKDNGEYWWNYLDSDTTCLLFDFSELNNEVEIIEDVPKEDKKIEKLDLKELNEEHTLYGVNAIIVHKINEIIDKINGEEND